MLSLLRSIIFPLKDNLRTLDDQVCIHTLNTILQIASKSDKLAEAFVQHFHLLLPMVDLVRNKHSKFARATKRPKSESGPKKLVPIA